MRELDGGWKTTSSKDFFETSRPFTTGTQLSDDQLSSSVFEARVDLDQVVARFHEAWPQLDSVRGQVLLTGNSLDVELESCHTSGILVSSGDVSVPLDDGNILVSFVADAPLAIVAGLRTGHPLIRCS